MSEFDAIATAYAWLIVPLVLLVLEPRKLAFLLVLTIAALAGLSQETVAYDNGGLYQMNVSDAVLVSCALWLPYTFIQMLADFLQVGRVFSASIRYERGNDV